MYERRNGIGITKRVFLSPSSCSRRSLFTRNGRTTLFSLSPRHSNLIKGFESDSKNRCIKSLVCIESFHVGEQLGLAIFHGDRFIENAKNGRVMVLIVEGSRLKSKSLDPVLPFFSGGSYVVDL